MTKTNVNTNEKKTFNLSQAFAMWKRKSKKGTEYFTGKTDKGANIVGYYNTDKKNPKEPDIRIYTTDENNKLSLEPITSLWCNATKKGNKLLNGTYEGKKVVGFITKTPENTKRPYFSCYYSDKEIANTKSEQADMEGFEEVAPADNPF